MSHISYNEFKNRFGDLGITKYTRALYLEEGCEEIGVIDLGDVTTWSYYPNYRGFYTTTLQDILKGSSAYVYDYEFVSDSEFDSRVADDHHFTINVNGMLKIRSYDIMNPTDFKASLKGKKLLYKKKGYYTFTFSGTYRFKPDIPQGTSYKVTLLERTVIETGSSADTGKIGWTDGYNNSISVGQTVTVPGTADSNVIYANSWSSSASLGYAVKIRIMVE